MCDRLFVAAGTPLCSAATTHMMLPCQKRLTVSCAQSGTLTEPCTPCSWLTADPQRAALVQQLQLHDKSQALAHARAAFARAAEAAPADTDVATGLGVLCHLSGDFAGAAAAFEAALRHHPEEYSLWNKLGATLANSSKSAEAKRAYAHALACKPTYMRAWANMGIAHSNLGDYEQAAQHYVKALTLNPEASSVWGYLKTAAVLLGRAELLEDVDAKRLDRVTAAVGVASAPAGVDGSQMAGGA